MKARTKVYLEAARQMADDPSVKGCCLALMKSGAHWTDHELPFRELFRRPQAKSYWWPLRDRGSRVIALCLMAAMVEAGDA